MRPTGVSKTVQGNSCPAKFRPTEDNIKWYLCKYCKKTTALDPRQRTKTLLVCLLRHSQHACSCWPGVENEILRKSVRYLFLSCAELASPSHFVRIQFFLPPVGPSVGISVAFWKYFLSLSPTNFSLILGFLPLCSEVNLR